MKVFLNGQIKEYESDVCLSSLLKELDLDASVVAVERNSKLVPRAFHHSTLIDAYDRIEIIELVGGG